MSLCPAKGEGGSRDSRDVRRIIGVPEGDLNPNGRKARQILSLKTPFSETT